jgi:ribosomal protein S18 acetylase RimI-like enzyme
VARLDDIELGTITAEEIPLAAGVAARGMRDNPNSIALFGNDPVQRVRALEPMFHLVLLSQSGPTLVARRHGTVVGIAALAPPDGCFYRQTMARNKTLHVAGHVISFGVPSIPRQLVIPLLSLGPGALSRISALGEAGTRHDPRERHQHVELVVVEAGLQGMGIGSRMMEALCRQMDELPEMAHLETDTEADVRFYERYGFEVTGEARVLGARNWYMQRLPGAES